MDSIEKKMYKEALENYKNAKRILKETEGWLVSNQSSRAAKAVEEGLLIPSDNTMFSFTTPSGNFSVYTRHYPVKICGVPDQIHFFGTLRFLKSKVKKINPAYLAELEVLENIFKEEK